MFWRNLLATCNFDHPEVFDLPRGKVGGSTGKVCDSKTVDCSAPAMRWISNPIEGSKVFAVDDGESVAESCSSGHAHSITFILHEEATL
jgi:hypothetical protein